MPVITFKVEPTAKNNIGWDVFCISWDINQESLTIHELTWSDNGDGTFTAITAELPSGIYGVLLEMVGVGREVKITVKDEPRILQPKKKKWPLEAKVSPNQTRKASVWYFQV